MRQYIPKESTITALVWNSNVYVRQQAVKEFVAHHITFSMDNGKLTVVDSSGNETAASNDDNEYMIIIRYESAEIVAHSDFFSTYQVLEDPF